MQTIIIIKELTKSSARIAWAVSPMGLGQSAILVFLPLLVAHTHLGYGDWAQLFALGMLSHVIGSVAWPLLLPRWGHRRPLLLGLLGYSASMLLFAVMLWLQSQDQITDRWATLGFAASRLLYGAFASALLPLTQSWCADISTHDQRLQSFSGISLQLALSRAMGPVLAGLLGWIHWLLLPVVLAIWPLLLTIWLMPLPEPTASVTSNATHPTHKRFGLLSVKGLLPPFWLGLIALLTTAFASSLQFQLSPALEFLSGKTAQAVSLMLAMVMVVAALLSVLAHKMQMRMPPSNPQLRMLWISALLMAGSFGLLLSDSTALFIMMALIISMGLAWLTPLYSAQLSLHQTQQHLVAAQLSLAHISGHLLGLCITALAISQALQCVYIWLIMLAALIGIASLSKSVQAP